MTPPGSKDWAHLPEDKKEGIIEFLVGYYPSPHATLTDTEKIERALLRRMLEDLHVEWKFLLTDFSDGVGL